MRERGQHGVEVAANVLLPAREVFDLLRRGAGIAAHLCVDLIEIVVLQIVIALLHPEYPAQDVRAAVLHRAAAPLLLRRPRHGGELLVVLRPAHEHRADGHAVFRHGVLDLERTDVRLDDFLTEIIEIGRKHLADVVQLELHLKIVLYVVIDQPEQADERLRIVEGRIDRRHLLIGRAGLVRDPERGVGAEHIGKAARRPVIAQLMEQLEQTARVARHGDVLPEIRAALLLEPALRAQLADEKARASGNIAQLVFVDVLALEGRVRELLLQTAAQHGVQLVLGQPELLPVCHAEHIERVRVQRPVRGRERREQLVRHGFKKFHKRYPPAEGVLPLVFRLIQLYGFRADFTMHSLSEKSLFTQKQSGLPHRVPRDLLLSCRRAPPRRARKENESGPPSAFCRQQAVPG